MVAVVVDDYDLRGRYEGVPTLCHFRLGDKHQHLGKWSVTIDGMGMDARLDSLESGSSHVSDDHEARQFCLLFVLAAIDHSLKSEIQTLSDEERSRLELFEREVFRYLEQFAAPDDDVEVVRLSIESIRLELATSVLDREIVRRCLYRIAWVAEQSTVGDLGELGEEAGRPHSNLACAGPNAGAGILRVSAVRIFSRCTLHATHRLDPHPLTRDTPTM